MNRRELIMMAAAIPIGAAAAAKHGIGLVINDGPMVRFIPPITPGLSVPDADGGFLVPKEMAQAMFDEAYRIMAIPPELIDKGES